jgi:radical SAM superfamily enzyme YgiQ (UPF0313 family)
MSSDLDVLFVRSRQNWVLTWFAAMCCEPLELEQLAAVAEVEGYSWEIYDPMVHRRSLESVLRKKRPRLVAITGCYPMRPAMYALAQTVRRLCPESILVAGGVDIEIDRDGYRGSLFDVLVYAGGGVTFQAVLAAWRANQNVKQVPGTLWKDANQQWHDEKFVSTSVDVTKMPMADRSHLQQYASRFRYLDHGPVSLLKTAYGCPYDCRFCCCKLLNGRMYTPRPIQEVVAELAALPTETVWIIDDTFLVNMDRVRTFARTIKEQKINKRLIVYARAGEIVQAARSGDLGLLQQAGLVEVIVGLEAVQADRLQEYGKQVSVDENKQCVAILRNAGIRCVGLFMVEPDSPAAEFKRLRCWIRENQLQVFSISIFSPFPGTEDFATYASRVCSSNPRHWDLRHLVMKPTQMSRWMFYWRYHLLSAGVLRDWRFVLRVIMRFFVV